MGTVFAQVRRPGPLTLVEDLGRPGQAAMGLGPSGALDGRSLRLANRLVANNDGAAGLEILLGGLELEFRAAAVVAVTGARGELECGGSSRPLNTALELAPGSTLKIGTAAAGLRYYLSVQGGLQTPSLLGSASADILSGMGPRPLQAGDLLERGPAGTDTAERIRQLTVKAPPRPEQVIALRISAGPRRDWFDASSWHRLTGQEWEISADSNRIGARLLGKPLTQLRRGELPSEGMVSGALQVPPSGLPTIFLADHPVTGGYPVIAVVVRADLDLLAQARPGQKVRFFAG
ncbi:biotin-dependent carboxyltransferase family protein [Paenarthrobacter sp. Z7-10]|uniref:5-oxoprolinase subunit C family protein n=1 Tax=Paenarthrobacter sp. Z7-10 TaxID=2787635 RepID=UPI0022A9E816|nr:biotin-dependent carboxyltransferase family protein [Paenarthrobacter sp. Z7-10]MCZ2403372.1 biotin-dependent carboxyltransferase family protein [Paenarthrobacter sp. Z7-10]